MRSTKEKLLDLKEEKAKWEKLHSDRTGEDRLARTNGIDIMPSKPSSFSPSYIKIVKNNLRKMLDSVSKTADRIALLMIDEMNNYTNIFEGTYVEIQNELGAGRTSVENAMIELLSVDFIRKVKNGRWMVNPAVGIGREDSYWEIQMTKYYSLRPYTPKKRKGASNNVS